MEKEYLQLEELHIWKESMELCNSIYDVMSTCRDYGLRNQLERSSVSIPSNIAEGYELNSDRGFIRHLYIAKGSCGELRTQLYIAIRRNYISKDHGNKLIIEAKAVSGMIQNFIKERKKRAAAILLKKVKSILLFWI